MNFMTAVHTSLLYLIAELVKAGMQPYWTCAQFWDTQSSEAAQEHEAKKDNPNVRPHLEQDQATVGMGNEHVAPGAGGMHTEVRACTCCTRLSTPHGASSSLNFLVSHDQAAIVVSCTLGGHPCCICFEISVAARAPGEGIR